MGSINSTSLVTAEVKFYFYLPSLLHMDEDRIFFGSSGEIRGTQQEF